MKNRMFNFSRSAVAFAAVAVALVLGTTANAALGAQTSPGAASVPATKTATASTAKTAKPMPSDAAIADAKAKGLVWVNLNTKVYHKDDAVYGKTKNGEFMTEADAQKAGARMAKASPIGKKKAQ